MKYLQTLADVPESNTDGLSKVCLGTLDVKDAFLMVDQPSPMVVLCWGKSTHALCKNLLGQRLGPKAGTGIYETSCQKRWLLNGAVNSRA